jgi:hypothetical protein
MKYNKLDIIAIALIYEGVTSKGGIINILAVCRRDLFPPNAN